MKNKTLNLVLKIILTILCSILACGVVYMLFKMAFFSQSIDEMMCYGIALCGVSGGLILLFICSSCIQECWKKDKDKKE